MEGCKHMYRCTTSIEGVQTSRDFCLLTGTAIIIIGAHLLRSSPPVQFFVFLLHLLGFSAPHMA